MRLMCKLVLVVIVAIPCQALWADDLTGANQFLCATVQATVCTEDGECTVDLPWNFNIPAFIEVDLEARRLGATEASGLDRTTPIEHLSRQDGSIVLQGYEMGRAFSFVITERTGLVTVAVATGGRGVTIFGVCTPAASGSSADRG